MASGKSHHETDRKLRLRSFSCDVYSGYSNIALRRAMKPSPGWDGRTLSEEPWKFRVWKIRDEWAWEREKGLRKTCNPAQGDKIQETLIRSKKK